MFVKEMYIQHVLFTWSAVLTKLKSLTFLGVLEAWCHCDFRKMEAQKVDKLLNPEVIIKFNTGAGGNKKQKLCTKRFSSSS